MAEFKPIVLVTGASAGLGAALAAGFAERGHNIVLVARREAQLNEVADGIAARGHERPHVIALDLAAPDAGDRLERALQEAGLEPEIVVNNAGFGLLGPAAKLDRAQQLAMVDLNVRIATDLALRFTDSLARRKGGILNVASVLGFLPGPGMAVYHATKAYLISFSLALHQEMKAKGIRVTVLCPGPIETEFGVRPVGYFARRLTRPLEHVVRHGIAGFLAGEAVVVPGKDNKVLTVLARLLPRWLTLSMVGNSKRRHFEAT
jgi:short-subunit dehydrogenase